MCLFVCLRLVHLLCNGKRYNPTQTYMEEKIGILLKEFQKVKLRLDKVKKQLNEVPIDDRRPHMMIKMRGRMKVPINTGMTMMTSHVRSR